MSHPEEGTIIEGIGDDVIYGVVTSFICIVSTVVTLYYCFFQRGFLNTIHQENEERVQVIREEIVQRRDQPESLDSNTSNRMPDREATCPICLAQLRYAIETNCGHIFCGQCMVTYWRHGNWIQGLKCPVCRSQVSILLRCFTRDEMAEASTPEREEIIREVNHYNRRYSGQPIPWIDYIRDLPTLLRHLWTEFFSVGGLVMMFRLRILVLFVIALLYFLSPLDIIPEAVFGILGLLDDLFILLLLAIYLSIMYRQVVMQRAMNAGT